MLVLSRHRDEELLIGSEIVVTVVDIRGDKVRLGVEAPREIPVHRREVYDAILREGGELRNLVTLNLPTLLRMRVERMAAERNVEVGDLLSRWIAASIELMSSHEW